jgi:A/G-specific adenine glycosylase
MKPSSAKNGPIRDSNRRLSRIAHLLVNYFKKSGRKFRWRNTRDPFRLGVAEILLQKTRAISTVPIYQQIVRKYKTPKHLGLAITESLEKEIRVLGLSRKRAHALVGFGNAIATMGVSALRDPASSNVVPGIGAYGSRAIACFGFGANVGIVDANVRRVLTRLFGLPKMDPRDRRYEELADRIVATSSRPRDVNYGFLDLAASICATRPKCNVCVLARSCSYAQSARDSRAR